MSGEWVKWKPSISAGTGLGWMKGCVSVVSFRNPHLLKSLWTDNRQKGRWTNV